LDCLDHMDKVLQLYLEANEERERQQHLDEILTLRAAPMIRTRAPPKTRLLRERAG